MLVEYTEIHNYQDFVSLILCYTIFNLYVILCFGCSPCKESFLNKFMNYETSQLFAHVRMGDDSEGSIHFEINCVVVWFSFSRIINHTISYF